MAGVFHDDVPIVRLQLSGDQKSTDDAFRTFSAFTAYRDALKLVAKNLSHEMRDSAYYVVYGAQNT